MILVVGLGNPGLEYVNTRHNVGYLTINELQKSKIPSNVVVRKSDSFMNNSGEYVAKLLGQYNLSPENLYIIHDDLDIPLGTFKIQFGRGPKDHNGLKSIDDAIHTDEYWHVRIGVDNRPIDNRVMGEEYVLQNFPDDERKILDDVIKEACKKLEISFKNIK